MSTCHSTILDARSSDTDGIERLSVALIGPSESTRETLANALAETRLADVFTFNSYPPESNDLKQLLEDNFDVIFLDLDADPAAAHNLVEKFGGKGAVTVMVYSERNDPKLAVHFVRAGARDYLLLPLDQGILREALVRAATSVCAKACPAEMNLGSPQSWGILDGQDSAEELHYGETGPLNERVSSQSLEMAAMIVDSPTAPPNWKSFGLPETLPGDFIDWDSNELSEMALGNSHGLEVAPWRVAQVRG